MQCSKCNDELVEHFTIQCGVCLRLFCAYCGHRCLECTVRSKANVWFCLECQPDHSKEVHNGEGGFDGLVDIRVLDNKDD